MNITQLFVKNADILIYCLPQKFCNQNQVKIQITVKIKHLGIQKPVGLI